MEIAKKNDFVEVKYTGYTNNEAFDSNVPEELKKINPKAEAEPLIVVIGEGMVVPGLDKALEEKEFGKEYEITLTPKEGFGERHRELVKTIPLKAFREQKVEPRAGMAFVMDNMLVKIIAVSGARVTADFNNPLAGKNITYKFSITRKVTEEKEKCETVFKLLFRGVPEFEIKDKVTIKGPAGLEVFIKAFGEKFKQLIGKELAFELKEGKKNSEEGDSHEGHEHGEHGHSHEHNHEGHDHHHEHGEHEHSHEPSDDEAKAN